MTGRRRALLRAIQLLARPEAAPHRSFVPSSSTSSSKYVPASAFSSYSSSFERRNLWTLGVSRVVTGDLWRQQVRHVKVNGSEVKQGNVIERKARVIDRPEWWLMGLSGRLYQVLKTQHTQQGRGGATIQVELRDVQSGLKSSERLRTSENIERVFVDEKPYTFLYAEGSSVILMEPKSFEQLELSRDLLGPGAAYLSDGMEVIVQQYDGQPFSATVPPKVTCTVSEAEPFFKGQSATPTYKRIVLENGQMIQAPSFITAGDRVVIDTSDNSYVTRAKE